METIADAIAAVRKRRAELEQEAHRRLNEYRRAALEDFWDSWTAECSDDFTLAAQIASRAHPVIANSTFFDVCDWISGERTLAATGRRQEAYNHPRRELLRGRMPAELPDYSQREPRS